MANTLHDLPYSVAAAPTEVLDDEAIRQREAKTIRKGFGQRTTVRGVVAEDFQSGVVDAIRANGSVVDVGPVRLELARDFGFCYGVDRAIDYAYETRREFPDRRVFLTTEIIHNPRVNKRMLEMGIRFLHGQYADGATVGEIRANDVVVLPAFGVSQEELKQLIERGCTIVDTTCGSVINVWKKVASYARAGITSVIHGKYKHEETIATASQATSRGGHCLVVLNLDEADYVADYIRRRGDRAEFMERFAKASSAGFDPDLHLTKIGVANQTTMLASESLEVSRRLGEAMRERWGHEAADRFHAFDTICPATQERQDAMLAMLNRDTPLDLALVVGGFNSSNTSQLLEIAARRTRAYHIEDVGGLVSATTIRHKPYGQPQQDDEGWLDWWRNRAAGTKASVGITGGASTPNRVIGDTIERLLDLMQIDRAERDRVFALEQPSA